MGDRHDLHTVRKLNIDDVVRKPANEYSRDGLVRYSRRSPYPVGSFVNVGLALTHRGRARRPPAKGLIIILAALAVSLALASPCPALADESATEEVEQRAIESLIASVARLTDATFLRNGKPHPASSAARFLREKWRSQRSEVRSAEDFIDRIASISSTTGKPYLIRFADGREVSSAEFLRAELAKLRARAP